MATHSSILAWKIPLTEEPGSYSSWGQSQTQLSTHTQMYLFPLSFAINENIEHSLFCYDLFFDFFI